MEQILIKSQQNSDIVQSDSSAGLQASVRSMTPVKQAENHVANSETMLAFGDVNQVNNKS